MMVVLTNEEDLKKKIREDLAKEHVFDEKKVEERFNQIIANKKEDLKALPAQSYVSVGSGKFFIHNFRSRCRRISKHISLQLLTLSRTFSRRLTGTSRIQLFNLRKSKRRESR